jgi:hypothetical protein
MVYMDSQALGESLPIRHGPIFVLCSNVSPESLGGIDRAADLRELGLKAQKRGLRVNFEALAWGRHINDHRDAWEAVRRIDRARAIGGSLRCSAIGTQVGRGTTAVLVPAVDEG